MGTYSVLIILSSLVIFSYAFDMIARRTKFPSVLLLLASGIGIRMLVDYFRLPTYNFLEILPTIGTVGLILIVLEGALELKYDRKKYKLILHSFLSALIILLATTAAIALMFHYFTDSTAYSCIINAIPYSIISSAIAIPSISSLTVAKKEFIVYESSLSDIVGILLFTFLLNNPVISMPAIYTLTLNTILITAVSVIFSLLLLYIIGRIKHQVKFFLIIAIIILVYSAGSLLQLPSLVLVLAFGLFLNNAEQIQLKFFRDHFLYPTFNLDLQQLFRLSAESAFLVRTFFFIIFGFIINFTLLNDMEVIKFGSIIILLIYMIRAIYLRIMGRTHLLPELFISPRGLISILLFISIPQEVRIPGVNTGLLFMVILLTSLIMSFGLMAMRKRKTEE
jgi:hypothetical protein